MCLVRFLSFWLLDLACLTMNSRLALDQFETVFQVCKHGAVGPSGDIPSKSERGMVIAHATFCIVVVYNNESISFRFVEEFYFTGFHLVININLSQEATGPATRLFLRIIDCLNSGRLLASQR